jgi:hypothetical protein
VDRDGIAFDQDVDHPRMTADVAHPEAQLDALPGGALDAAPDLDVAIRQSLHLADRKSDRIQRAQLVERVLDRVVGEQTGKLLALGLAGATAGRAQRRPYCLLRRRLGAPTRMQQGTA